jgi:hypothetical protein
MRHNPDRGIMSELVQDDDRALFGTLKSLVRRHLNDVERRAVKGAFTTDPNRHAARLNDDLDILDALGDRLRRSRWRKGRDAINLRSMKDRERSQHRNTVRLAAAISGFVLDLDRLVEIDRRRLLALAHLPSSRRRLPVAAPARIAARKGEG